MTKFSKLLVTFTCLTFTAFQFSIQGAQAADKPNVIFILADDLGSGDLHTTGHPYAKTPNLDKLAARGIQFERAYMPAAWCAPSRCGTNKRI